MKFNIKYITFSALLCASMVSCDLDVVPPSDISTETFWKNEKDAWNGLNALYAELPGMDIWDEMYTDNAHSHKPWEGPYELVQTNGITAGNDFGYGYSTVRIANNFIINVDKCDISEGLKERMKAEARFFRAWQYLQLTTKFGKAYLFTDVPEYNAPYAKRDPAEKVQAFILSELNEIAEILPDEYDGSYLYESSRITRAAALALRALGAGCSAVFDAVIPNSRAVIAPCPVWLSGVGTVFDAVFATVIGADSANGGTYCSAS